MKQEYRVKLNRCGCSIETCNCGYYAVYDNNDGKHSFYDDKETAEAVCRFLNREHITDGSPCWCEPETDYKDPDTGVSVIVHKRPQ